MLLSTFIEKEDLRFFETTVEKQSLRLSYKLSCHLMVFDKQSSSLENRTYLREQLALEIEKIVPKKLSLEQKNILLKPGGVPQTPFASISISHCALWAVLLSPNSILLLISLTLQQNILPTNRFSLVLI